MKPVDSSRASERVSGARVEEAGILELPQLSVEFRTRKNEMMPYLSEKIEHVGTEEMMREVSAQEEKMVI